MLAWKARAHGIDPMGSTAYVHPGTGAQQTFPNIAGHRDVNATECPGGAFYDTLPLVRVSVTLRVLLGEPALPAL